MFGPGEEFFGGVVAADVADADGDTLASWSGSEDAGGVKVLEGGNAEGFEDAGAFFVETLVVGATQQLVDGVERGVWLLIPSVFRTAPAELGFRSREFAAFGGDVLLGEAMQSFFRRRRARC